MTAKQRGILVQIRDARGEPVSIDDLVSSFGATKQAMQSTLRILERKGWVRRSYDLHQTRVRMLLHLTPAGESFCLSL